MAATMLASSEPTTANQLLGGLTTASDRPLLRGRLHQLSFFASIPAGIMLVSSATSTARPALVVYALTWSLMFGTSATYHRLARRPTTRFWMRRADHSMIYVHIAGASTPLCLLALPGTIGLPMLGAIWLGALGGIANKLTRLTEHYEAGSWLYAVLGGAPFPALPILLPTLGWEGVALLVATVLLYAAGGICFFRKRPDPIPTIFGYHEVWHVFTVLAGLCQFALMTHLATWS